MKSLMEEASSVAKAIEKAWERAGSPREFTVKVLDKPEKNFFGFTTKSAKVAILFEQEQSHASHAYRTPSSQQDRAPQPRQQQKQYGAPQKRVDQSQERAKKTQQERPLTSSTSTAPATQTPAGQAPKKIYEPLWTPERIDFARQWIAEMQKGMQRADIVCDISTDKNAIRIIFQKPLIEDIEQEKQLFRSWAYLLMQTLRHTYKQQFKHIKIILKSNR